MKKSVTVILVLTTIAFVLVLFNGYGTITGMQALDLPAPPAPPGMEQQQEEPEAEEPVAVCGDGSLDEFEECESDDHCGFGEMCVACTCIPEPTDEAGEFADVDVPEGEELEDVVGRLDAIEEMLGALDLLPAWEERLNNVEAQAAMAANMGSRIDGLESRIEKLEVDVRNLKNKPDVQAAFFDQVTELKNVSKRNAMLSISLSVFVLLIVILLVAAAVMGRMHERKENKELIRHYLENYSKAGYSMDTLRMHLRASGWPDKIIDEAAQEATA